MKKIETQRLLLLPFSEKNISKEYLSWLNNKELMKYSEQRHSTHTYESSLKYLKSFAGTGHIFIAIYLKESNLHIGNINAYIDQRNKIADMGILIGDSSVKGQGVGLEAWLALMGFLFSTYEIRKITAGTLIINTAMINIMKKSNMQKEATFLKQYLVDGQEVDSVQYAIFKAQFKIN